MCPLNVLLTVVSPHAVLDILVANLLLHFARLDQALPTGDGALGLADKINQDDAEEDAQDKESSAKQPHFGAPRNFLQTIFFLHIMPCRKLTQIFLQNNFYNFFVQNMPCRKLTQIFLQKIIILLFFVQNMPRRKCFFFLRDLTIIIIS